MSLKAFIRSVCVQPAVYWEEDGPDGMGGVTFLAPTEILVRWDDASEAMADSDGVEFVSRAMILTPDNLKERSRLYLGTLADLTPPTTDPLNFTTFELRKMARHPEFRSKTFDVFIGYI